MKKKMAFGFKEFIMFNRQMEVYKYNMLDKQNQKMKILKNLIIN